MFVIIFCGGFGDERKVSGDMTFNFDIDNETRDFYVDGEFVVMIVMNFNDSGYSFDVKFS